VPILSKNSASATVLYVFIIELVQKRPVMRSIPKQGIGGVPILLLASLHVGPVIFQLPLLLLLTLQLPTISL
jgi:hypothetical protein